MLENDDSPNNFIKLLPIYKKGNKYAIKRVQDRNPEMKLERVQIAYIMQYVDSNKNPSIYIAGAPGQAGRSGRTNPQVRAARGAALKRARTPIAARASREPRATSRVIPASGERRNPHPQEQQGRPHLRADVRTRDVAFAMTRSVAAARGACALIR